MLIEVLVEGLDGEMARCAVHAVGPFDGLSITAYGSGGLKAFHVNMKIRYIRFQHQRTDVYAPFSFRSFRRHENLRLSSSRMKNHYHSCVIRGSQAEDGQ